MDSFELRPNLLLGVSGAATQVDGGNVNHTWEDWYKKGYIKDGSDPAIAVDHWTRWREDLMLMRSMGIQAYRFSVEWARVEPEEGKFDEEAIVHIKEEIMLMLGMGIKPLLTLHHFSNPMWFEEKGGWENPDNIRFFVRYAEKIVKELGHLVSEYITINEPNAYAANGYNLGMWPPGKTSTKDTMQVISVMAAVHIRCYRLIHNIRRGLGFKDTKVAFAMHMRVYEPKSSMNPLHHTTTAKLEKQFQSTILEAMVTGKFTKPMKNYARARLGRYVDFHALCYYSRHAVTSSGPTTREGAAKSDLGKEIYPQGIIKCAQTLYDICNVPIYVVGNGTCDNDDKFRSKYIYDHLDEISRSSLPIERYYYWCFTDSFEWNEGLSARFGLVSVDAKTQERSIKKSGEFYSKLIKNRGVTDELFNEYVAGVEYPR